MLIACTTFTVSSSFRYSSTSMKELAVQPRWYFCDSTSLYVAAGRQNGNVWNSAPCEPNTSRPTCEAITLSPEYSVHCSALPIPASYFLTSKRARAPVHSFTEMVIEAE